MRAPVSMLKELCGVTEPVSGVQVAADLVRVGLEEEGLFGGEVTGPLVVGRVLDKTDEPQKNGKTIHFCHVDVGNHGQRAEAGGDPSVTQEIVCGAHNFEAGDLVVVVLPGAVLPGGFEISSRKTYGHPSNGMICSERELGLGDSHDGIIVLTDYFSADPARLDGLEPGDDAIALLGLDEETVEVNVTPDRGYCFSIRGIAREWALSTGRTTYADPVAIDVPPRTSGGYSVRLDDSSPIDEAPGCDRYVARIVRGVDPTAASPSWMATRLVQMGMRPISLAVDVTNYLMLLTGQPLHAFDLDTLSGQIVVRRAEAGERLTTLDDVERVLDPADLLITDGGTVPLAIAGVMGGATSEVSASTTNVLIEAAHFDPISIARSSRRHRLSTEASKRFERGVDPAMAAAVAELAVQFLVEHGGGVADPEVTDADLRTERSAYRFDTTLAQALIEPGPSEGLDHGSVVSVLQAIGCTVTSAGDPGAGNTDVDVLPPSWRPDLRNGPDLVEEVARVRGYDKIPSVVPQAPAGRGLTESQRAIRLISDVLAAQGLTEALSYPFVSTQLHDDLGHLADDPRRHAVRLSNPLSDEQPLLRTNVLDSLLPVVRLNAGRGTRVGAFYEIGRVFRPASDTAQAPVPGVGVRPTDDVLAAIDAAVPPQPRHLGIALSGDAVAKGPLAAARRYDATDAIALAQGVARSLGVTLTVAADAHTPFHPGRRAALHLPDGQLVGHAGELHPKVVAALELPERTCAVELSVDALCEAAGGAVQATRLTTFPAAHSDVALVVDDAVPAAEVAGELRRGADSVLGENSVEDVLLFDVYRGDQIGEGKKSLAFRLVVRSAEGTLKTAQVSQARDAAVARAAERFDAVQR